MVAAVLLLSLLAGQPDAPPARSTPAARAAASAFRPSLHGFRFPNSFRGSPLPKVVRASPLLRGIATGAMGEGMPARFGLCGGMSLAACDLFLAGRLPPPDTATPMQDTPLFDDLQRRQSDSLGPGAIMATKFLEWMNLPTNGPGDTTAARSMTELPAIVSRLRAGEFAPIGMVLVRAASNPRAKGPAGPVWSNHQVLAFGITADDAGVVSLHIYDPNEPGRDDVRLVCTPRTDADGEPPQIAVTLVVPGTPDKPVRGIFPMPYPPATPADLGFRPTRPGPGSEK